MADELGKQIDLHPRRRAVIAPRRFAAPRHGTVVAGIRHRGQHRRVDLGGKNPVELQMNEGLFNQGRTLDGAGQMIDEPAAHEWQALAQPTSSVPAKKNAISMAAFSAESEPWTELASMDSAKSLRIVP